MSCRQKLSELSEGILGSKINNFPVGDLCNNVALCGTSHRVSLH